MTKRKNKIFYWGYAKDYFKEGVKMREVIFPDLGFYKEYKKFNYKGPLQKDINHDLALRLKSRWNNFPTPIRAKELPKMRGYKMINIAVDKKEIRKKACPF